VLTEKLDKIIALLEQLNARLNTAGVAPTSERVVFENRKPIDPNKQEQEFFIIGDAKVWKSGKGSFNAAKINHEDGGTVWSIGVPVYLLDKALGNDWLRKGDVIRASGRVENGLYNGVPRPQMFADSITLIARKDTAYIPAPAPTEQQEQTQPTTTQDDREEQIPEDNIPF